MRNRRAFLKSMAYAGAGGLAISRFPAAMAQARAAGREIYIGGFPATVIDIHAHCEIKAVEQVVRGTPVEMQVREMRLLGQHRIDQMDELGIDMQTIHIGNYWWYKPTGT